eukprot:TRINITY_DN5646_c0_g3_i7.p1 TRINITY_DN5646_c0_g3~~TRINITY_DN5646_c0_g3_i7.p1  ORF type:complete len:340 (+),score=154.18 TRINITY_DN5646_c0_g3_i7:29-1048(+)
MAGFPPPSPPGGSMAPPPLPMRMGGMGLGRRGDPNAGVIATNDSATEAKFSAVQLGYWADPFIHRVCQKKRVTCSPMVRRGYFTRVTFVESALRSFHTCCEALPDKRCQVIALGCGFDTTFFRLRKEGHLANVHRWVDIDFESVIAEKQRNLLGLEEAKSLADGNYRTLSVDLRDADEVKAHFEGAELGLDLTLPTLVISECVLVYMRPGEGDAVIQLCGTLFKSAAFLTYEQINSDSPFGAMMVQNLQQRGCPLLSLSRYPTISSQAERYLRLGFEQAMCNDMNHIHAALPQSERQRLNKVEMLDELEEFALIQSHYVFTAASKGMDPGWHSRLFDKQ